MKRRVLLAVVKFLGEVILITLIASILVVLVGSWRKWDTAMQYSNAFFIAGALVMIGGMISRMSASGESGISQGLYAESFRGMSPSERTNFVMNASSSFRRVILAVLSGVTLMIISMLVLKIL